MIVGYFVLLCVSASLVHLVDSSTMMERCDRITKSDLGNTTHEVDNGLLSEAINVGGESSGTPRVRVISINIVCESQAVVPNKYRHTSVVVSYTCASTDNRLLQCSSNDINVEQFDFGCAGERWTLNVLFSTEPRTSNPEADFSTDLESRCSFCAKPTHTSVVQEMYIVSNVTHCQRCNCTEGLMRCTDNEPSSPCCNYFQEGVCVKNCDDNLVPNEDSVCQCSVLSASNGDFVYTPGQAIGNSATLTCNPGYVLDGTATAVCEVTGWSNTPSCRPISCPAIPLTLTNGNVTGSMFEYLSTILYMCNSGFGLDGTAVRTCQANKMWSGDDDPECTRCTKKDVYCANCTINKQNGDDIECIQCDDGYSMVNGECKLIEVTKGESGCDAVCIIGIILALLAVIITSIVVAVVLFVLYKYLNDPATKLAKTDTEGLNGVARDNPLYVDPAAVVGEGVDGLPENGVTETTPLDSTQA